MNTAKAKLSNVKNHVIRNRGKYGFAAGAITAIALQVALASEVASVDIDIETTDA
jgi:hypothetical protein